MDSFVCFPPYLVLSLDVVRVLQIPSQGEKRHIGHHDRDGEEPRQVAEVGAEGRRYGDSGHGGGPVLLRRVGLRGEVVGKIRLQLQPQLLVEGDHDQNPVTYEKATSC